MSNNPSINNLNMMNGFAPVDGGAFINNGVLFLKENIEFEANMEVLTPKVFTNNSSLTISEDGEVIINE
jgi:hypothetical protein